MTNNRSAVSTTPNLAKPNAPIRELKIISHMEIPIKSTAPVPTYNFLSTLGIFCAALISHYSNMKALHALQAQFVLKASRASTSISIPSIFLKLSELLPSKNKLKRTGRPWAKDIIKLTFQGLESSPPTIIPSLPESEALPPNTPAPDTVEAPKEDYLVAATEARIVVPVPETLSLLKEKVDKDIAFHAASGTFACRLRANVGESVIPTLIAQAARIERLVEFMEVLHKHRKSFRCESISLGRIIMVYGSTISDPTTSQDGHDANSPEYKAVIEFGAVASTMTISFEKGNPHLLIADRLGNVLNGSEGLAGVAQLLPYTLPALRALDSIEGAWSLLSDKGEVFIFIRSVEWYRFSYTLVSSPSAGSTTVSPRKITFDLKLQQKKGEPWWYVRRVDQRDKEGDDIDALLKPVWNASGEGYRGMRVNAVAQPNGAEELLRKIDGVIRAFASGLKTEGQVLAPGQGAKHIAPVAPMAQAQAKPNRPFVNTAKRQQPTPNQTQSQSTNHSSMEVVEID